MTYHAVDFMLIVMRVQIDVLFFFQAEDGIRDIGVTGVQTCALPISKKRTRTTRTRKIRKREAGKRKAKKRTRTTRTRKIRKREAGKRKAKKRTRTTRRSEERRVGKECRSRWSPYH